MKRKIINHWTAGQYLPNFDDYQKYHRIIDFDKKTKISREQSGIYSIADNDNCNDGHYAAHTGGMNTRMIGISVCAMLGFESAEKQGNFPITKEQLEKLFEVDAKLLIAEGWTEATPENLQTHFEVAQKVLSGEIPRTSLTAQNIGKIDICFLPPYPEIKPEKVGDFIREKTNWYIKKMKGQIK